MGDLPSLAVGNDARSFDVPKSAVTETGQGTLANVRSKFVPQWQSTGQCSRVFMSTHEHDIVQSIADIEIEEKNYEQN